MNELVLNLAFDSESEFVPIAAVQPNMDLNYYCGISDACDMLFGILSRYSVPVEDDIFTFIMDLKSKAFDSFSREMDLLFVSYENQNTIDNEKS
jgi:hypothetical protein